MLSLNVRPGKTLRTVAALFHSIALIPSVVLLELAIMLMSERGCTPSLFAVYMVVEKSRAETRGSSYLFRNEYLQTLLPGYLQR